MGQAEAQFLNVIVRRMVFRRKTYQMSASEVPIGAELL